MASLRKSLPRLAAVLGAAVILAALSVYQPKALDLLRLKGFDAIQSMAPRVEAKEIILIDIDEDAIDAEGQWPWPRSRLGDLLERLGQAGARTIVLGVILSEPDRFGEDAALVQALEGQKAVLAQVGTLYRSKGGGRVGVAKVGDPEEWLFQWSGILGPIDPLASAAKGLGVANLAPEPDGVTRRLPIAIMADGRLRASLPIEALRVHLGQRSFAIKAQESGVEAVQVRGVPVIPTDAYGRIWIDFRPTFQRVPSHGTLPDLSDKIAVVGLTAEGLSTIIATPNGEAYAQDIVAAALHTALTGTTISRPATFILYETVITVAAGSLLVLLALAAPHLLAVVAWGAVVGGLAYASVALRADKGLLLDAAVPSVLVTLAFFAALIQRVGSEVRLRRQIRAQFAHYLSPALITELQRNPEKLRLGGETRTLTLMFCDIRGFTAVSEQYKTDPQGLTKLINRFLTPMTFCIMENSGTIDKYMGDCIMAFWNAPLDINEQKELALRSALEMQDKLTGLNDELDREGLLPIRIGIGLNTGDCVVGNMGGDQRFDYSALGDAVNLASRLEGQSKDYGVVLVVSEFTLPKAQKDFSILELDLVSVKGKTEAVRIFTAFWKTPAVEAVRDIHDAMLSYYREQDWDRCLSRLATLLATPTPMAGYHTMMRERVEALKLSPPAPDWDGVYRPTSK